MEYKLAKQLKDAGFPQQDGPDERLYHVTEDTFAYAPTLEELIEACAPFGEVRIVRYSDGKGKADIIGTDFEQNSTTLTEAVAKLFIALRSTSTNNNSHD